MIKHSIFVLRYENPFHINLKSFKYHSDVTRSINGIFKSINPCNRKSFSNTEVHFIKVVTYIIAVRFCFRNLKIRSFS